MTMSVAHLASNCSAEAPFVTFVSFTSAPSASSAVTSAARCVPRKVNERRVALLHQRRRVAQHVGHAPRASTSGATLVSPAAGAGEDRLAS